MPARQVTVLEARFAPDPEALAGPLKIRGRPEREAILAELLDQAAAVARPTVAWTTLRPETACAEARPVFPFVATCGSALAAWAAERQDRLQAYWAQVIMRFALQAALDRLEAELAPLGSGVLSRREPGISEDWPLSAQKDLFALFAGAKLDVELNECYVMRPAYSVSGVYFFADKAVSQCLYCPRRGICPGAGQSLGCVFDSISERGAGGPAGDLVPGVEFAAGPRFLTPDEGKTGLGLAVDLGSTKIAVYLLDLASGETLASGGTANPQSAWGADILTRIAAAMENPSAASDMRLAALRAVNELAERLCAEAIRAARPGEIQECVVVGNTVMQQLFLGLDVRGLGQAPFAPARAEGLKTAATDLGLVAHENASVYLPPVLAGFVGSDHLAALLTTGILEQGGPRLVVDIGTNTEISLLSERGLFTCSAASGPAFEGAHITCGMLASPGAVDRVRHVDGRLAWESMADAPPLGLCGSGALDAVAALVACGAVGRQGTILTHPLVGRGESGPEALIVPAAESGHGRDIRLTRKDIGNLQLAKAAVRCGIDLLLEEAGLAPEALEEIVVAGAFGSHLSISSAKAVGLFPDLPESRFRQAGNAAGLGACLLLLSERTRREATALPGRMTHVDLAACPNFAKAYTRSLELF